MITKTKVILKGTSDNENTACYYYNYYKYYYVCVRVCLEVYVLFCRYIHVLRL